MFTYVASNGARHQVNLEVTDIVKGVAHINRMHADADLGIGTAFTQMQAAAGIVKQDKNTAAFGLESAPLATLLDGSAFSMNTQQNTSPYGTAARAFTVISLISDTEAAMARDLTTDINNFYSVVGHTQNINSEHFEQPVIDYGTVDGPDQGKASRVAQGAKPNRMMFFKTADRIRRIGAWNVGLTWTDQALKATTLDFVSLSLARFLAQERDSRAYRYISDLFLGNGDMVVGAVSSVTSTSLDAAATGGVLTHKAYIKWLARNKKYRTITHVFCTIGTYLQVEGRTGRPGSNAYDPRLSTIDPQAVATNQVFGGNVKFIIVDDAANGGPIAEGTLYGVDARSAVTLVRNSNASYQGVEAFAMSRTTSLRIDWAEECFRSFGDTDLRAFDVLTIS